MHKKPFGLIVKSKTAPAAKQVVKVAAFGASDDEEDEMATLVSGQRQSASTIRIEKTAERMHQKAVAEDPDIYDYDNYLEQKEEVKAVLEEEKKKENKGRREAKYAGELKRAHERHELEKQLRDERKQVKEREEENGKFDDKEIFITSSYKKQLEMMEEFKKEEILNNNFDGAQDTSTIKFQDREKRRIEKREKKSLEMEAEATKDNTYDEVEGEESNMPRKGKKRSAQEIKEEQSQEMPKTKQQRLEIIKNILKKRNSREVIEEMRQCYFERRNEGVVPLPH